MSAASRNSFFRARLAQLMLNQSKGFTLIELLVVIVIVGILTAVAVPTFLQQVRRSRTAEAQGALTTIVNASEVYRSDYNEYPADYAEIDINGSHKAKYVDTLFTNFAPNYQDPTQEAGANTSQPNLEDQGSIWQTTANAGVPSSKAYKNRSGAPIKCAIGQGADTNTVINGAFSEFYVKGGCNLNL